MRLKRTNEKDFFSFLSDETRVVTLLVIFAVLLVSMVTLFINNIYSQL